MRLSLAASISVLLVVARDGFMSLAESRTLSLFEHHEQETHAVESSPVRKVINLLQSMAKKGDLQKSLTDNDAKVPAVQSDYESARSQKAKLQEDLKMHIANRAAARTAMAEATAVREKENKAFVKKSMEMKEYIRGLSEAIPAAGLGGSHFLQTSSAVAASVRRAASADTEITDDDRDGIVAFFTNDASTAEYLPSNAEALAILKGIKADYDKNLAEISETEREAVKLYQDLMAAKAKEVRTLSSAIQKKTARVGDLSVDIANMKHDLSDAEAMLDDDQKFIKNLESGCKSKQAAWDERQRTRGDELNAIHETIKILSNDDASDLFGKSSLSSAASMLQLDRRRTKDLAARSAAAYLQRLQKWPHYVADRPEVRFLEMALLGKKVDFSKVTKMINSMISLLRREQADDDQKSTYCNTKMSMTEDKAKDLSKTVKEAQAALSERTENLGALADEIKALKSKLTALDRLAAEATAERKAQSEEYIELMSNNNNAKEVLEIAKTRLNRFYNPDEPAAATSPTLLQEASRPSFRSRHRDDPPPSLALPALYDSRPETHRVINMIDVLIGDLTKEMVLAQKDDQSSQRDYEAIMEDAANKRSTCLKSINEKESAKAENEEMKTKEDGFLEANKQDLKATKTYKAQLHEECDWLLQNFALRKTARADEIDNLGKAKSVLSGAAYSFVQAIGTHQVGSLLSRARQEPV